MKLHIITVGEPKLSYAKAGWKEYVTRLSRYHSVRTTHIPDKHNDSPHLLQATGSAYKVGLVIKGQEFSSPELATFLEKRALEGREVCFIIGGPDGLPAEVIRACDWHWSFGKLTLPHDLAMVVLTEALYRASSLNAGSPYHH